MIFCCCCSCVSLFSLLFFSSCRFLFVVSETLHLPLDWLCQSTGSSPSSPLQVDGRFWFLRLFFVFCFLFFLVILFFSSRRFLFVVSETLH
ncbi:hypothetical protein GBAR_LOCUS12114, partial [Geodia barretti]